MNRKGYLLSLDGCVKKKLYLFSYYLHIDFSLLFTSIYDDFHFMKE